MTDMALSDPVAADLVAYLNGPGHQHQLQALMGARRALADAEFPWDVRGPLVDRALADGRAHYRAGYTLMMAALSRRARTCSDVMTLAHATGVAA